MNYKIIAIIMCVLVIGSFGSALISGELTSTAIEKEDYKLINEPIKEKEVIDTTKAITKSSLSSFTTYDFKGFDFKLAFEGTIVYDDDKQTMYYIYNVTKPIATYNEQGDLNGFAIQSMQVKQGHWYERKDKCTGVPELNIPSTMPYIITELVLDDKGQPVLDEQTGEPLTQQVAYTDEKSCTDYGQKLTQASLENKLKEEMKQLEKLKITAKILTGELNENYVYEKAVEELPDKKIIEIPIK